MDEGKKEAVFDLNRAVLIYYPPVDFKRAGVVLPEQKIDAACELFHFAKAHKKFYPHLLKWAGNNDPCGILCQLPLWIVEVGDDLLGGLWAEMIDDHSAALGIIKNPMVSTVQVHEIVDQFGPIVIDGIFRIPGITRIMAACDIENFGARDLAVMAGFPYYGTLKQHIVMKDRFYDYGLFIRLKGEVKCW